MDYKEKYEQALERARMINNGEDVDVEAGTTTCEYIFPELKESEDERIRKELIGFLQLPHPQFVGERKQEKWIAWLEKQGTSYTKRDVDDAFIEKAVKHIDGLIEFLNELGHQLKKERIIEDFKNYMKGE